MTEKDREIYIIRFAGFTHKIISVINQRLRNGFDMQNSMGKSKFNTNSVRISEVKIRHLRPGQRSEDNIIINLTK